MTENQSDSPPHFALRFLAWFCPSYLYETIEGDLIEQFEIDLQKIGKKRARRRFVWNVMKFFRSGIILRNKFSLELNQLDMFLGHFKFAIRIFLKDKFFSTLNILGLALGIAVSILLLLILQNDLTYDQYYVNHQRIFRLGCHLQAVGLDRKRPHSSRDLGTILKDELPEVQEVVLADTYDHTLVKYENKGQEKAFYEENIIHTDSAYFRVFNNEFIAGDPKTCLSDVHAVVVTESIAKKYFGDESPLDKSLIIKDALWKVTAVIKDLPNNTHFKFDILLSGLPAHKDRWIKEGKIDGGTFWNPDVFMYLLFPEHYNQQDFLAKFPAIYNKYFKSFGDQVNGKYTPILEPLDDIHFHSGLDGDEPQGNLGYLYAFTVIGIFIVILACINYMNLTTAKSVNRATEIAVKKIVGSGKRVLVLSFLSESIFLCLISLIIAVALVFLVLNTTSFNQLIGKNLMPDFFHNPLLLFGTLGIALSVGLISGLYPAFYLPGIPTIIALKGTFKNRKSSQLLRRVLVTSQFAISIFVVVCTLFMRDQIDYVQNTDLGFRKDNILLLAIQDSLVQKQINVIKNEFLQNPNITAAAISYQAVGMNGEGGVMWAESETGMRQEVFQRLWVGDDYLKLMGMKLLYGRDFQPGSNIDAGRVFIANEAAARLMGWGKAGIGKKVRYYGDDQDGEVIGVVKDFNYTSLHHAVEPLFIIKMTEDALAPNSESFLHLKVKGENLKETIRYIQEKWAHYDPNHPFEYFFLDQRFNEQYKADEVQNKLLAYLSYVCIFISLLGLIGLSAFTATQRTKEIGVRKVLGASVSDIIILLSRNVLFLVILAAILVIPASYWVMTRWMKNFAYRMELNYFLFLVITVAALSFVFLTVMFQSLKTARSNPVDSLKYE